MLSSSFSFLRHWRVQTLRYLPLRALASTLCLTQSQPHIPHPSLPEVPYEPFVKIDRNYFDQNVVDSNPYPHPTSNPYSYYYSHAHAYPYASYHGQTAFPEPAQIGSPPQFHSAFQYNFSCYGDRLSLDVSQLASYVQPLPRPSSIGECRYPLLRDYRSAEERHANIRLVKIEKRESKRFYASSNSHMRKLGKRLQKKVDARQAELQKVAKKIDEASEWDWTWKDHLPSRGNVSSSTSRYDISMLELDWQQRDTVPHLKSEIPSDATVDQVTAVQREEQMPRSSWTGHRSEVPLETKLDQSTIRDHSDRAKGFRILQPPPSVLTVKEKRHLARLRERQKGHVPPDFLPSRPRARMDPRISEETMAALKEVLESWFGDAHSPGMEQKSQWDDGELPQSDGAAEQSGVGAPKKEEQVLKREIGNVPVARTRPHRTITGAFLGEFRKTLEETKPALAEEREEMDMGTLTRLRQVSINLQKALRDYPHLARVFAVESRVWHEYQSKLDMFMTYFQRGQLWTDRRVNPFGTLKLTPTIVQNMIIFFSPFVELYSPAPSQRDNSLVAVLLALPFHCDHDPALWKTVLDFLCIPAVSRNLDGIRCASSAEASFLLDFEPNVWGQLARSYPTPLQLAREVLWDTSTILDQNLDLGGLSWKERRLQTLIRYAQAAGNHAAARLFLDFPSRGQQYVSECTTAAYLHQIKACQTEGRVNEIALIVRDARQMALIAPSDGSVDLPKIYDAAFASLCDVDNIEAAEQLLLLLQGEGYAVQERHFYRLMKGHCLRNDLRSACNLLRRRQEAGFSISASDFGRLLRVCVVDGNIEVAERIFAAMIRAGYSPDMSCYVNLMEVHLRASSFSRAIELLETLKNISGPAFSPDIPCYTAILNAYVRLSAPIRLVAQVLEDMQALGLRPTAQFYGPYLHAMIQQGMRIAAERLIRYLELLSDNGTADLAPTVTTYNILLNSYTDPDDHHKICDVYDRMRARGVLPSAQTLAILLRSFDRVNDIEAMERLVKQYEEEEDLRCGLSSSLDRLRACGEDYQRIYDPLIRAYLQADRFDDAYDACLRCLEHGGRLTAQFCRLLLLLFRNTRRTSGSPIVLKAAYEAALANRELSLSFITPSSSHPPQSPLLPDASNAPTGAFTAQSGSDPATPPPSKQPKPLTAFSSETETPESLGQSSIPHSLGSTIPSPTYPDSSLATLLSMTIDTQNWGKQTEDLPTMWRRLTKGNFGFGPQNWNSIVRYLARRNRLEEALAICVHVMHRVKLTGTIDRAALATVATRRDRLFYLDSPATMSYQVAGTPTIRRYQAMYDRTQPWWMPPTGLEEEVEQLRLKQRAGMVEEETLRRWRISQLDLDVIDQEFQRPSHIPPPTSSTDGNPEQAYFPLRGRPDLNLYAMPSTSSSLPSGSHSSRSDTRWEQDAILSRFVEELTQLEAAKRYWSWDIQLRTSRSIGLCILRLSRRAEFAKQLDRCHRRYPKTMDHVLKITIPWVAHNRRRRRARCVSAK
ncbi:hypothetical protein BT69DRAFT_1350888 [Atractiella rhizophila]|nr:hypothetical protein BT69DRAFT_1350888 [Atractiella rhizophila]